jgi:hypothetical protein
MASVQLPPGVKHAVTAEGVVGTLGDGAACAGAGGGEDAMRGEGQGKRSWQDKAAELNRQEVLMFLNALWDVYEATARAYFGASSS